MSELIRYFLYLGSTGFGGPLVLVQQMREHYVDDKKSLTGQEFDQAFTLIKAMPGPVAFQMATFLGKRFFGFKGALAAGFFLVLPAFILMVLAGIFYDDFGHNQYISYFLTGVLFSSSAVILLSLKNLVSVNQKDYLFWIFLVLSLVLFWHQVLPEPALIILFGLLAVFADRATTKSYIMSAAFFLVDWAKLIEVFKTCVYAGAVVFGTGFALLPVLRSDLVDTQQLITLRQFNDGVVFGQMTPGPITITASFLGYQISGFTGALAATLGVFLFPFFHMSTWFPLAIGWFSRQKWIGRFTMGATAAVVAGILTTLFHMNREFILKPIFWVIFLMSLLVFIKKKKTSVLLIFVVAGLFNIIFANLI